MRGAAQRWTVEDVDGAAVSGARRIRLIDEPHFEVLCGSRLCGEQNDRSGEKDNTRRANSELVTGNLPEDVGRR